MYYVIYLPSDLFTALTQIKFHNDLRFQMRTTFQQTFPHRDGRKAFVLWVF